MYRIEAIAKKLGAHYRSEPFESRPEAEAFRADFLVDPQGMYFRIVRMRKRKATSEGAVQQPEREQTVNQDAVAAPATVPS